MVEFLVGGPEADQIPKQMNANDRSDREHTHDHNCNERGGRDPPKVTTLMMILITILLFAEILHFIVQLFYLVVQLCDFRVVQIPLEGGSLELGVRILELRLRLPQIRERSLHVALLGELFLGRRQRGMADMVTQMRSQLLTNIK